MIVSLGAEYGSVLNDSIEVFLHAFQTCLRLNSDRSCSYYGTQDHLFIQLGIKFDHNGFVLSVLLRHFPRNDVAALAFDTTRCLLVRRFRSTVTFDFNRGGVF